MNALLEKVRLAFTAAFGAQPELAVQAPGRVNLIGEHTDYNDGFVLPCAINHGTVIGGRRRSDRRVRVLSVDYGGEWDEFSLDEPIVPRTDRLWANYVRGVVKCLLERTDNTNDLNGADLAISGDIPQGAGLSSSASLEVATGSFFTALYQLPFDATQIALIGQQAENHFVGCNCGIMDQLISARGKAGHALLIDCRSLQTRPVAMPEGIAVVIVNSNVRRGLVGSEYNARRRQCEEAARFFGVKALRDVSLEDFAERSLRLDPLVARRARHVITDSQRAEQLAATLPTGDLVRIGQLMAESHASMREDFEITCPAVDALVDIIKRVIGSTGGVRMTGGGFGGCVVALMPHEQVPGVGRAVAEEYPMASGLRAEVYVCRASQGAGGIA